MTHLGNDGPSKKGPWKDSWLVCSPNHYDVSYEINAWMDIDNRPDRKLAVKQWRDLHDVLEKLECKLMYIDQVSGLPDMVFTANGGLVKNNKAILPRFTFKERQGEAPYFEEWFKKNGFETFKPSHNFEGEGDALFVGSEKLFCGYGFRSEKDVYPEIAPLLGLKENNLVYCELVDPYFYHLDTCFCPLNEKLGFYYPEAFTMSSQKSMEANLELFRAPKDEARRFASNAVVFGSSVVVPAGCPSVCKFLKDNGFTPYEVQMSEYLKAGGAAKCLSLKLYN